MKTWRRATSADGWCGSCNKQLYAGDPICDLQPRGLSAKFTRCPDCAGEPINEAQIAEQDRQSMASPRPSARPSSGWQSTKDLARDVKLRQAGRDE